jgi:hypothetical protein
MARCTIFRWFGIQKWFDARFEDLCAAHDDAYVIRKWRVKLVADFELAKGFVAKGYFWLGLLSLPYTLILGTLFWVFKKEKNYY